MDPTTTLRADATPLYQPYEEVVDNWPQLQDAINRFGDAYCQRRSKIDPLLPIES